MRIYANDDIMSNLKRSRKAILLRIKQWDKILKNSEDPESSAICKGTIEKLQELLSKVDEKEKSVRETGGNA